MTPVSLRDASKIERAVPAIRIKRKRRFPLAAKRDQPIRLGSLCDLKPPEVIDQPNPGNLLGNRPAHLYVMSVVVMGKRNGGAVRPGLQAVRREDGNSG